MGRWDENDTWVGEGLRREVFFFRSGGADLYGSLYAAAPISSPLGVVMCNSWGIEGDQANRVVHPTALGVARAGGASLVFHYPGSGDSHGDPRMLTMETMADAAAAAVREGERRLPECSWMLVGFMLGAAVACLALEQAKPEALLMAQPFLRPGEYFEELQRKARRVAAIRRSAGESLFGYSPSKELLSSAAEADTSVLAALTAFQGPGAVVRYSSPELPDEAPERFERIEAEGTWRFASQDYSKLGKATRSWLRWYMRGRENDADTA